MVNCKVVAQKILTKKLVIFWLISIPLLLAWFFVLQWKNNPAKLVHVAYNASRVVPFGDTQDTILKVAQYIMQEDDVERTYLILLQNNMELRPGGGYIGSFAIVKVKNGEVTESAVHDTANFDGRIPDTVKPPYPMEETMGIGSWKLRDSNWMPDFPSNARVAEKFYQLGGGTEQFDAVFAVNASILDVILAVTGPITLEHYPGTYESGDAVMMLEYQVEQGYKTQGIAKGDRKVIMNDLAHEIIARIKKRSLSEKMAIVNNMVHVFESKDVQLFFKDKRMSDVITEMNWGGSVDRVWDKDYVMIVDANLASYKTDHVMERAMEYDIDFSGAIPQALLTVRYTNTASEKDWKTNDYQTYMRVYVPEDAWFTDIEGCAQTPQYGKKYGKRYVGCLVHVGIGVTKDVVVRYNLPMDFKNRYAYDLKIQKQAGVHNVPVQVSVKNPGTELPQQYDFVMESDVLLSEMEAKK